MGGLDWFNLSWIEWDLTSSQMLPMTLKCVCVCGGMWE